jgi:hypothetical protein
MQCDFHTAVFRCLLQDKQVTICVPAGAPRMPVTQQEPSSALPAAAVNEPASAVAAHVLPTIQMTSYAPQQQHTTLLAALISNKHQSPSDPVEAAHLLAPEVHDVSVTGGGPQGWHGSPHWPRRAERRCGHQRSVKAGDCSCRCAVSCTVW